MFMYLFFFFFFFFQAEDGIRDLYVTGVQTCALPIYLSEVESVAVTSDLPFNFPNERNFAVEGQPAANPDEQPRCGYFVVSPGYFETLQVPVLQGREFHASDNVNSNPVVIVDRAFARRYFANENP